MRAADSPSVTCEELIKAQPSIRLAGKTKLSREERQRISDVTKTLAMRDECDCCMQSSPNLVMRLRCAISFQYISCARSRGLYLLH